MCWIMSCSVVFTKLYLSTCYIVYIVYLFIVYALRLSIQVWSKKVTSAKMMFDKLNINMLNFIFASTALHVPNVLRTKIIT